MPFSRGLTDVEMDHPAPGAALREGMLLNTEGSDVRHRVWKTGGWTMGRLWNT